MERLIIFRHGKAERDSASGDDFDRALTDRGRGDAEAIGRMLAMSGSSPDLALVSSAVRAVQTYEAARAAFPRALVKTSKDLYLASGGALMRAVRAEDAACIMLVAHNPGLHDLAVALAREGRASSADLIRLEEGFPTSAAAVFRFDVDGTPQLVALHTPKGRG